jgi:stage V sporulation protein R
MSQPMSLPPHLWDIKVEIEAYARGYGLDFFETSFEILDYDRMNEVAAYGGFPSRYPHWRHGMEYDRLSKGYTYGVQKIYEMVINNDPCYAYLLEGNSIVDQKTVMAHVFAHCDFFKNNYWFSKTNRKMMDEMANHASRIRRYIERHGLEPVEAFLDTCLSVENLIDPHAPFIARKPKKVEDSGNREEPPPIPKIRAKEYMDEFINPREFLERQKKRIEKEKEKERRFPEEPERDVLKFLLDHAPLEKWEREILDMVREEAYYFAPQRQTKIMNEGWATYWHSKIMTEKALRDSEIIDFADAHSGVVATAPGRLNPYKLGVQLFKYIEERWDKGRFGKEWEECDDLARKRTWDLRTGLGRQKLFQVRQLYNDVTFIDEFLTPEFCREEKLYTFGFNKRSGMWEITDRDFKAIKEKLLFQLTNFGDPFIYVENGNFENRGELLLVHKHEGLDLKLDEAKDTLANLQKIWRRPVNLATTVEGKGKLLTFDGREHKERTYQAR